jgi:hypothetical protein
MRYQFKGAWTLWSGVGVMGGGAEPPPPIFRDSNQNLLKWSFSAFLLKLIL